MSFTFRPPYAALRRSTSTRFVVLASLLFVLDARAAFGGAEITLKSDGKSTSATNRQLEMPIASASPRLKRPRCEAIIMLPKPTIEVADVSTSVLNTLPLIS